MPYLCNYWGLKKGLPKKVQIYCPKVPKGCSWLLLMLMLRWLFCTLHSLLEPQTRRWSILKLLQLQIKERQDDLLLNSAYAKAVLNHSYKILLKDKLVQTAWINLRSVIFGSFMVYTMQALLTINLASYVFGLRQGCPCLFWHGLPGSLGGVSVGVAGFWANWQLKSIKERLQDLLLATSLSLRERLQDCQAGF